MGKWVEIRLLPEQYDLQDAILEHFQDVRHPTPRDTETCIRLSVPMRDDTEEFLSSLRLRWKEAKPGRPSEYPIRKRSSLEMSPEVWAEVDRLRGNESRAVFIEQTMRKALGMPALEPIG